MTQKNDISLDFSQDKVVGILGGMGPEATADFFSKLLALTPASKDQEHLRILIDSNGKIPDRTEAILQNGASPLPVLCEMARGLQASGADVIVIPCNTAHYFHQGIQECIQIPLLHMQHEVFKFMTINYPEAKTIGLLATEATIKTELYQSLASKKGLCVTFPSEEDQANLVTKAIKLVKSGKHEEARVLILQAAHVLIKQGADLVIAGCTEIPLVLNNGDLEKPVIDSALVLAKATFEFARA